MESLWFVLKVPLGLRHCQSKPALVNQKSGGLKEPVQISLAAWQELPSAHGAPESSKSDGVDRGERMMQCCTPLPNCDNFVLSLLLGFPQNFPHLPEIVTLLCCQLPQQHYHLCDFLTSFLRSKLCDFREISAFTEVHFQPL